MTKPRTPKAGRRPGNQDTRGQILAAARQTFAAKGFAGASMRSIATEAGVDPALIHHYFETKQQLFLATVAIPVPIGEIVERLAADGIDGLGDRLVTTILRVWDSEAQPTLVAAVRAALTDPETSRLLGEFVTLEIVVRVLESLDIPAAERVRRGGLVASQILGIIVGRYVLRLPLLTEPDSAELAAAVGPTLQRYLSGRREEAE